MTDDSRPVAKIELLYQQRMTVRIPVESVPSTPESAFRLLKNTDPEFVADVMPAYWRDVMTQGQLDVVDIQEVNDVAE